jgi:antirestriction protein
VAAQKALGDLYPIFEVWASDNDGASVEDFNDNYQGEFDSVEDFARAIAEDTGTYFNDETGPLYCIDWATAARDLMYDYQEIRVAGMSHIVRNL